MEIWFQQKNKAYKELWMDWENYLEKKSIQKIEKTVTIKVKLLLKNVENKRIVKRLSWKHRNE